VKWVSHKLNWVLMVVAVDDVVVVIIGQVTMMTTHNLLMLCEKTSRTTQTTPRKISKLTDG
jgi:hypothetical protein